VIVALALADLAIFVAAQVIFFLTPPADAPRRVDGILVLGPATYDDRYLTAAAIAARYPGMTLLYSLPGSTCPRRPPPATRLVCFEPVPSTTRGEARFAADYARRHGWHSLMVVTTADQLARARLRMSRCWPGTLVMVASPSLLGDRLRELAYQNAAMIKAEVWQRGC
jgi:hypothetical protein